MVATAPVFTIYCHTAPNGKRYVGQTTLGLMTRWAAHVRGSRTARPSLFAQAIKEYGAHGFIHSVLDVVHDQESANLAETQWIARLGTIAPHGYNVDAGGGAHRTHDSTRRIISDAKRRDHAAKTQEERSSIVKKGWASRTLGERQRQTERLASLGSPEERSARTRKGHARRTPEQRKNHGDKVRSFFARMTPEQRKEHGRKVWASRRAAGVVK